LGIGDWGLGIGDWAQSPIPNPQSPIPKSPISTSVNTNINSNNVSSNKVICERCFKLNNYRNFNNKKSNETDLKTLKAKSYFILNSIDEDKLIKEITNRFSQYSQIFYILDIKDLEGSLNFKLLKILKSKKCGVVFIINKFDLLPEGTSYERVNILVGESLKKKLEKLGLKYSYTIVSSKTGFRMEYLLHKIKNMRKYYKTKEIYYGSPKIYILGNCNVGKSTFINMMINKTNINILKAKNSEMKLEKLVKKNTKATKEVLKELIDGNSSYKIEEKIEKELIGDIENDHSDNNEKNLFNIEKESNLTTSPLPGTTLNIKKVNFLKYGCKFFDTPGLPTKHSIFDYFSDDIKSLFHLNFNKRIKPQNIHEKY
jgi:ribosome biogenesis GTPase A